MFSVLEFSPKLFCGVLVDPRLCDFTRLTQRANISAGHRLRIKAVGALKGCKNFFRNNKFL